jgi:hypothetical protein
MMVCRINIALTSNLTVRCWLAALDLSKIDFIGVVEGYPFYWVETFKEICCEMKHTLELNDFINRPTCTSVDVPYIRAYQFVIWTLTVVILTDNCLTPPPFEIDFVANKDQR